MHYGIYLPNFGPLGDARTLANLANDAENAGWDGVFIWDHIAPADSWPDPMVDPWIALTAIAMRTARIRLGALVTPLPRRRPWKVARETVSLDHLSGGRLVFGVGIGAGQREWNDLDEEGDLKIRAAMLDEGLTVLNGLWTGKPYHHDGRYYHLHAHSFLPTPCQSPRVPIWVGGFWPHKAPLRRAAHWDGVFALFREEGEPELAALRDMVAYVRDQRRDNPAPFDMVYAGRPTPGDDPTAAAEIVAPYAEAGVTWWLENIVPFRFGGTLKGNWHMEALRERIIQGPPRVR